MRRATQDAADDILVTDLNHTNLSLVHPLLVSHTVVVVRIGSAMNLSLPRRFHLSPSELRVLVVLLG